MLNQDASYSKLWTNIRMVYQKQAFGDNVDHEKSNTDLITDLSTLILKAIEVEASSVFNS